MREGVNMQKPQCLKLNTCPKIQMVLDKDLAGWWQYAEVMQNVCDKCNEKGDTTVRDGELKNERTLGEELQRVGKLGAYFKAQPEPSRVGHLGCRGYGTKPGETFVLTTRLGEQIDLNRDDAVYMKMALTAALKMSEEKVDDGTDEDS